MKISVQAVDCQTEAYRRGEYGAAKEFAGKADAVKYLDECNKGTDEAPGLGDDGRYVVSVNGKALNGGRATRIAGAKAALDAYKAKGEAVAPIGT